MRKSSELDNKFSKKRIAFIDHSFHKNTKSGDFFREILTTKLKVVNFWDNSWQGGSKVKIADLKGFDCVLYWQSLSPFNDLRKIKSKVIWAPMYDGCAKEFLFWENIAALKINVIAFSDQIVKLCQKFQVPYFKIKYYISPKIYQGRIPSWGKHVFFWYRGSVKFSDIKKFLDPEEIDSFTYFSNPDPFYKAEDISKADQKKFKMKIIQSEGLLSQNDYLKMISGCNICIAPRVREGIGAGYLESFAMGLCVIGNDDGTMNEYIQHNKNGYLYNIRHPKIIHLDNFQKIRQQSKKDAGQGFYQWEKSKLSVLDFIQKPFPQKKMIDWIGIYLWWGFYLISEKMSLCRLLVRNFSYFAIKYLQAVIRWGFKSLIIKVNV